MMFDQREGVGSSTGVGCTTGDGGWRAAGDSGGRAGGAWARAAGAREFLQNAQVESHIGVESGGVNHKSGADRRIFI
jgi:hypothetical protein